MYPNNPPKIQVIKIEIFIVKGKQIIWGAGNKIHINILPPINLIIIKPNILFNIVTPESLINAPEKKLKSPLNLQYIRRNE